MVWAEVAAGTALPRRHIRVTDLASPSVLGHTASGRHRIARATDEAHIRGESAGLRGPDHADLERIVHTSARRGTRWSGRSAIMCIPGLVGGVTRGAHEHRVAQRD